VHSIFKFSVNTLGSSLCTESLYSDSGEVGNQGHLCEGKKYVVELAKVSITIFGRKLWIF